MRAAPKAAHPSMDSVIEFTRARIAELELADWHTLECAGVAGPSGSCCEARAAAQRQAAVIRERIGRLIHAASQASTSVGVLGHSQGVLAALCGEVLSDAAMWSRHAAYDPSWKDPAVVAALLLAGS